MSLVQSTLKLIYVVYFKEGIISFRIVKIMSDNAAILSNSEQSNVRSIQLSGHVGFDSIPKQLVKKCKEKGFAFNIMCIGETGLGKSTLMDTIFNAKFNLSTNSHDWHEVKLYFRIFDVQEKDVKVTLTFSETQGYGDQINKNDSFKPVLDYIDLQFERYLEEELKLQRSLVDFKDFRIHVCLYFISPTGHGLKSFDLECMKKLDSKVNLIPIIAKADTISESELHNFKEKIMAELKQNDIQIYKFPIDDETVADNNSIMNDEMPFAVVGSTEFVNIDNKSVRARQYPWGTVIVEDQTHCDLVKLRDMLISTNMEDLREQTHLKHYELYRQKRLEGLGYCCDLNNENNPVSFQHYFADLFSHYVNTYNFREMQYREMLALLENKIDNENDEKLSSLRDEMDVEYAEEKSLIDEESKQFDETCMMYESLKSCNKSPRKSRFKSFRRNRKK